MYRVRRNYQQQQQILSRIGELSNNTLAILKQQYFFYTFRHSPDTPCRLSTPHNPPRSSSAWSDVMPFSLNHMPNYHYIKLWLLTVPARGKSYIGKKIARYVNWLGYKARVFNIGNYRRLYMQQNNIPLDTEYFDNKDEQNKNQREEIAMMAIDDMIDFINNKDGSVAVLDGTNSTRERRKKVNDYLAKTMRHKYYLFWVESICDDPRIIENNIKKVKIYNPDFEGMAPENAEKEFYKRINIYTEYYQPVEKDEGVPFLKTINIGQDFIVHNIRGYLQEKLVTYVMNLTISSERIIYLLRHGETQYNIDGRIGGDPELSKNGQSFAKALKQFFETQNMPEVEEVRVLTSTLRRTIQTAEEIQLNEYPPIQLKVLDEINAGICETLTYSQVQSKYPQICAKREQDKLRFRYPSGQSYLDVISRLQPLINWIQRQKHPIIVVAHQAVLRCIYAYFFKLDNLEIPHIKVPLHSVVKLIPEAYFFNQVIYEIDTFKKEVARVTERKGRKSVDLTEILPKQEEGKPKRMKKVESQPISFPRQF